MANVSLRDIERDLEQEKRRQDEEAFIKQQLEEYRAGRIQGAPPPIAAPRQGGLGGSSHGGPSLGISSHSGSSSISSRNTVILKMMRFMLILAVAYVILTFYRAVKGIVGSYSEPSTPISPPINDFQRGSPSSPLYPGNYTMINPLAPSSDPVPVIEMDGSFSSGGTEKPGTGNPLDHQPDISHALNKLDDEEINAMKKEVDSLVDGNNQCVPKRRIILSVNKCGLGNRMVSLASTIMLGLLMDRVVELDWQNNR